MRLRSRLVAATVIVVVAVALVSVSVASAQQQQAALQILRRAAAKFAERTPAELLFFMGTAFLALLQLQRRAWVRAAVFAAVGVAWLAWYLPVAKLLQSLGADSFAEATEFDLDEARFWFTTAGEVLRPHLSLAWLGLYAAAAGAAFVLLQRLLRLAPGSARRQASIVAIAAWGLMGLAVYQTAAASISLYLSNSADFVRVRRNFASPSPAMQRSGAPIDLLVYIGESTSALHMSLYGYARQTTPQLAELARQTPGVLVFNNVFSTHTHTSTSLLEALSFGLDANQAYLPIGERRRVSVVDVLMAAGLPVSLVSNQGMAGTWNQASSIVFRNARSTVYSTDSRLAGNRDDVMERPFDHEFFAQRINPRDWAPTDAAAVVFFHSYAGHGIYLDHVPPAFRAPVDQTLASVDDFALTDDGAVRKATEAYDSTLRYVDYAVANALRFVEAQSRPMVMLYFPDHGELPGTGHDSARFSHEMVRIPLLLYFNAAARRNHPDLYAKYAALAGRSHGKASTLAQIPSTLLDLLGVRMAPGARTTLQMTAVMGAADRLPPIVVRRTTEGITFVDLNRQRLVAPVRAGQVILDKTDDVTRAYVAALAAGAEPTLCASDPFDPPAGLPPGSVVAPCGAGGAAPARMADLRRTR